jgi:hypothetical protein
MLLPKEVGDAELGDHVVHIGARDAGRIARLQRGTDPRTAVLGRAGQADDGLAAGRARCALQEFHLRGQPAEEVTVGLIDTDLARQVDRDGLCHRDHLVLGSQRAGVADDFHGLEAEQGVAVDQVVELAAAHGEAGDDLARLMRLAAPGQDAFFEQRDDGVGDHVAVDADVRAVGQVLERFVGDPPRPICSVEPSSMMPSM